MRDNTAELKTQLRDAEMVFESVRPRIRSGDDGGIGGGPTSLARWPL